MNDTLCKILYIDTCANNTSLSFIFAGVSALCSHGDLGPCFAKKKRPPKIGSLRYVYSPVNCKPWLNCNLYVKTIVITCWFRMFSIPFVHWHQHPHKHHMYEVLCMVIHIWTHCCCPFTFLLNLLDKTMCVICMGFCWTISVIHWLAYKTYCLLGVVSLTMSLDLYTIIWLCFNTSGVIHMFALW